MSHYHSSRHSHFSYHGRMVLQWDSVHFICYTVFGSIRVNAKESIAIKSNLTCEGVAKALLLSMPAPGQTCLCLPGFRLGVQEHHKASLGRRALSASSMLLFCMQSWTIWDCGQLCKSTTQTHCYPNFSPSFHLDAFEQKGNSSCSAPLFISATVRLCTIKVCPSGPCSSLCSYLCVCVCVLGAPQMILMCTQT